MNDSQTAQPLLVIIAGPPGTGKTWLSKRLALDCGLPVLRRDDLKELLFDSLGVRDRQWSQQLGGASYDLLFHMLRVLLATRRPCLVESNFGTGPAAATLCSIVRDSGYRPLQVLCRTEPDTLAARLRQRTLSGERHLGHADLESIESMTAASVVAVSPPLSLDGPVIDVDTTDFAAVDYESFKAQIVDAMGMP